MAHHSETQPRVPKGAPESGEWVALEGSEAVPFDTQGLSDAEYNADGSFHFPPRPRSAAQVLAFWSAVEVSDEALEKLRWVHNESVDVEYKNLEIELYELADLARRGKHERTGKKVDREGRKKAQERVDHYKNKYGENWIDAGLERYRNEFMHYIRVDDARTIARASQAHHQASALEEAERDKVWNTEVYLNATDSHVTIAEIERMYEINAKRRGKGIFAQHTLWTADSISKELADLRTDILWKLDRLV